MTDKEKIMSNRENELQQKLSEYYKRIKDEPKSLREAVVTVKREKKYLFFETDVSNFDFEEKDGNTIYEVTGHFNKNSNENFIQKISRMVKNNENIS